MLEIELGRPTESQRSVDLPSNTGVFNVGPDLPEANDMLDECIDNTSKGFEEAVEACLNEATFIEESYRDAAFDDSNFGGKTYLRIVRPLECELRSVSGFIVEDLDNIQYNSRQFQRLVVLKRQGAPVYTPNIRLTNHRISSPALLTASEWSRSLPETFPHEVCLFDDSDNIAMAAPEQ